MKMIAIGEGLAEGIILITLNLSCKVILFLESRINLHKNRVLKLL